MKRAGQNPNIRISSQTHASLRQLARESGESMQAVLERAVERYRRERFLRAANAEFAALKHNTKAWKEEIRERAIWKQTLEDHLDRK